MPSVDLVEMGESAKNAGGGSWTWSTRPNPGIQGSLSCIDIPVPYRGVMRFDPENPDWDDRDRFIMSKGHASLAVYSILRDLDVLVIRPRWPDQWARCQGHVDRKWTRGVDFKGSRHGPSSVLGLHSPHDLMGPSATSGCWGDGGPRGQIWEAAMATTHLEAGTSPPSSTRTGSRTTTSSTSR